VKEGRMVGAQMGPDLRVMAPARPGEIRQRRPAREDRPQIDSRASHDIPVVVVQGEDE
jgi:hypothetical protein